MRRLLVLLLALSLPAGSMFAAEEVDYAVGGGYSAATVNVSGGNDIDTNGWYTMFRRIDEGGVMLTVSLSSTDSSEGVNSGVIVGDVESDLLRLAMTFGYMWRRDNIVRPFLGAGFSQIAVEESIAGIRTVDDSSFGIILVGGVEVGKEHHTFYSDLAFDSQHKVDVEISGIFVGPSDYDLLELHIGYLYRF